MKNLALWIIAGSLSAAQAEVNLHVSATANTGGDGSQAVPYQNPAQARDGIRSMRKAGILKPGAGAAVHIAPGVYPLQKPFELAAQDSGSADAPIVYRAAGTGKVLIQGGTQLKPNAFKAISDSAVLSRLDEAARGKVRVCDLAATAPAFPEFKAAFRGTPASPWLYVNGQPMTLARWPNKSAKDGGWARFSKAIDTGLPQADAADAALRKARPGSFVFDDPRPARWNLAEGVWLLGYWTHDWSDEVIRIASYDRANKAIKLAAPHNYGIKGRTWGNEERRFFALNALEELDAPGEWYLDRPRKRLYFYPDGELSKAEIVLATLTKPLVVANGVKHLKLVGIDFQYGHGSGIVAKKTEHFEIAGCVVANLAGTAISIDGSANTVRSCDVFNIGRNGISLRGGDRMKLTPSGNLAENNHIHHFGIFQRTYAPGISVGGCGQIVRNNCIHDAPHSAVLYSGNEHLFERNEIYRVVMETGDAGAFYTGRDWTSQGNVLRHNFIHDLGGGNAEHVNTMGIYLDDCDSGDTLVGNVLYRAGRAIMIGGGRDNAVINNLVIDCPIGLHIDSRGMTWKQWNDPAHPSWCLEDKAEKLAYTKPPWSTRYPRLATIMKNSPRQPLGNKIRSNVFVDCDNKVCNFDANVRELLAKFEIAENLVVNRSGDARGTEIGGFANIEGTEAEPIDLGLGAGVTSGISLQTQQWIREKLPSFETIPFEKIGLYRDEYRRGAQSKTP